MKTRTKTLGILGGGQLGRMSALAAARLGIKVHVYCPEENSPASQVAARTFVGKYEDNKRIKEFADSVDVVTYEFENIPLETIRAVQKMRPVHPDDRLLEIAQDRIAEKCFLNDIGIETPRWAQVVKPDDAQKLFTEVDGSEFILKTTRFGYDGKGQVSLRRDDPDFVQKWKTLKTDALILEEKIDFACELSVIVARDKLGQTALYGPMLNEHKNHVLWKTTVPARLPTPMEEKAKEMARLLADAVDLVGVLALELFVTKDGRILANEIAPRPHNSGHWTIDACAISQFEQHVRTVCGLPVGPPDRHSDAVMINLLGDDVKNIDRWLETKNACLHLYGKDEIKPGRKMGHVTLLSPLNSYIEAPD